MMRILDHTGHDAQVVSLGDDLTLRIELKDQHSSQSSTFAMFARNLYARSTNGESLFLIDGNGCPIDSTVFSALKLDPIDNRSLYSRFKAFRFPSTGVVNFEVQIRFCQQSCEPIKCPQHGNSGGGGVGGGGDGGEHVLSLGRRRRRSVEENFREIFNPNFTRKGQTTNGTEDDDNGDDDNGGNVIQFAVTFSSMESADHSGGRTNLPIRESRSDSKIGTDGKQEDDWEYRRTRSHQSGFAYPSSNYHYYGNRDLSLNSTNIELMENGTNLNQNVVNQRSVSSFVNNTRNLFDLSPTMETKTTTTTTTTTTTKPSTIEPSNEPNQLDQSDSMWDISNGNSMPPHHLDWNTDDRDKMADPIIADHRSYTTNEDLTSMDDADDGTWNHVQSNVINPPLPLTPTVANEVPLSLAIMVDGDDDDPHHVGTVLQHRTTLPPDSYRSKSDEAAFVDNYANSVDVNHGENSDHHDIYHNVQPLHRNYADMARTLQTKRPDLHRYSSSSSSSSSSSKHYGTIIHCNSL